MFMSVVLPEPEAPTRATISPRSMESETPSSAGTTIVPMRYTRRTSVISMSATRAPPSARSPAPQRRREGIRVRGGRRRGREVAHDHGQTLRHPVALDLGARPVAEHGAHGEGARPAVRKG